LSSCNDPASSIPSVSRPQRNLILAAAFLAWMFAGLELSMFVIAGDAATIDVLTAHGVAPQRKLIGSWFTWYQGCVMLGAATGGWVFGWLGDRHGRTRSMAWSVLWYSVATGLSFFITSPWQLLFLRFLVGMGIGGVWPNAVSLVAEAWPNASRPFLAGLLGTAANFGFVLLGALGLIWLVTADSWRWVPLVGTAPILLGIWTLMVVPESPKWLAESNEKHSNAPANVGTSDTRGNVSPLREIFSPPLLRRTILGILLGAIPVIGTASNGNWAVFWSGQATQSVALSAAGGKPLKIDPSQAARRKAMTQIQRSTGGIFGSLLGGWIASFLGRRLTYFMISLLCLVTSTYLFGRLDPFHPHFQIATFLLGFIGVTYFGWLPLYLPELFPTRVRSTGTGVSFNTGRVFAAAATLGATGLITLFHGDFARVGLWTGAVYGLGMIIILFSPSTGKKKLED
jgi:SHS family sialic acid transporter-like MFS transporter